MIKIIGRDLKSDYVILDPKNRVSRKHLEIRKTNEGFFIKDLKSLNGTYVNSIKLAPEKLYKVNSTDRITLSIDYKLDLNTIFNDPDVTKILNPSESNQNVISENNTTTYIDGEKTVVFDRNKTKLGDVLIVVMALDCASPVISCN